MNIAKTANPGFAIGSITFQNTPNSDNPSILPAFISDEGNDDIYCFIKNILVININGGIIKPKYVLLSPILLNNIYTVFENK